MSIFLFVALMSLLNQQALRERSSVYFRPARSGCRGRFAACAAEGSGYLPVRENTRISKMQDQHRFPRKESPTVAGATKFRPFRPCGCDPHQASVRGGGRDAGIARKTVASGGPLCYPDVPALVANHGRIGATQDAGQRSDINRADSGCAGREVTILGTCSPVAVPPYGFQACRGS